jgi:carbon storage regulator CsrA
MLILTRRPGDSILISIPGSDEKIEVCVVQVGNQAKLGIAAPNEVVVPTEELAEQ